MQGAGLKELVGGAGVCWGLGFDALGFKVGWWGREGGRGQTGGQLGWLGPGRGQLGWLEQLG